MIPDETLAEWERLAAAATPGELLIENKSEPWEPDEICVTLRNGDVVADDLLRLGDANLFVAARTALPQLITEVRRLRAENEKLRPAQLIDVDEFYRDEEARP